SCLLLLWLGLLMGCLIPINLTSLGAPTGSSGEPPSLEPLPDEKPCIPEAIAVLEENDPVGAEVYRRTGRKWFIQWIQCMDLPVELGAAVHESVHYLSFQSRNSFSSYAFFLPSTAYTSVTRHNLYSRSEVGAYLQPEERDDYYEIYLTGKGGAQDFLVLLDEVNAYTFSLISATNLQKFFDGTINSRDGLATFMLYLELYLHHGRTKVEGDYRKIKNNPEYLKLIKTLWENAENALIESAPYSHLAVDDEPKWRRVYEEANLNELKLLYEGTGLEIGFDERILKAYGQ
ncbi:MAG TPA: hypothetical protein VMX75_09525, partial [Spirochaetia bacterium]|nr:hypothetical protein [Spirochaetia bacterium]